MSRSSARLRTVSDRRAEIAEIVRRRIVRALQARSLAPGDRLPSAHELAAEFGVDHRLVLAAYRALADDDLVEMRRRGGIYISAHVGADLVPLPAEGWLTEILAQGASREIPIIELHDWLRRAVETLRLRAVAVQGTADQIAGLCRELRDDYGLETTGLDAAALANPAVVPAEVRRADVVITTEAYADVTRAVASRAGVPVIVVTVRPDVVGGEWRLLLRRPVYVVVRDERFVDVLHWFFADVPGSENVNLLVVGRDDLGVIPPDAPTYITQSARAALGDRPIAGRILPAARLFSRESSRELIRFIVRANLDALAARRAR